MKKVFVFLFTIGFVFSALGVAGATPFYAVTNQIGYSGTVTYIPIGESTPVVVSTSIPRDGYVYISNATGDESNYFMSNWFEDPQSNVNDSFFQIWDNNGNTDTSISGTWDSSFTEFNLSVTGGNANYADDYARAWMPDQSTAARGVWTDYTLTLTASGMTIVEDGGWYVNNTAPTSISGTFSGTFVSDVYTYTSGQTTFENTYQVELELNSNLFDDKDFTGSSYNYFAAPVPEPSTIILMGIGLLGLVGIKTRKKKS